MTNNQNYLIHYGVKKEDWSPEARARFDARHRNKNKKFPEPKTINGHTYSLSTGRDTTEDIRRAREKGAVAAEYTRVSNHFGTVTARNKLFDELESIANSKRKEELLSNEEKKIRTRRLPNGRIITSRRRNPNGKAAIYGYHWGKTTPIHDGHYESPSGGKVGNHDARGLKQAIEKAKQIQAESKKPKDSTSRENLQNDIKNNSNAGIGDKVRQAKAKARRGPKTKNGIGYKIKPKKMKSTSGDKLKTGAAMKMMAARARYGGKLVTDATNGSAREKYRVRKKKNNR